MCDAAGVHQDAGKIRNKRYIELSTQKGGIFFTTPALKSLSDAYADLSNSYEKKQSELVKEVIAVVGTWVGHGGTGPYYREGLWAADVLALFSSAVVTVVATYCPVMDTLNEILAQMDVLMRCGERNCWQGRAGCWPSGWLTVLCKRGWVLGPPLALPKCRCRRPFHMCDRTLHPKVRLLHGVKNEQLPGLTL